MNIALNSIVAVGLQGRIAVIAELFPYYGHSLAHAHYVDTTTGNKMVCPDKRCKGEHTCPIHGRNVEPNEVKPFPLRDLNYYQRLGFISKELANAHRKANPKQKLNP